MMSAVQIIDDDDNDLLKSPFSFTAATCSKSSSNPTASDGPSTSVSTLTLPTASHGPSTSVSTLTLPTASDGP